MAKGMYENSPTMKRDGDSGKMKVGQQESSAANTDQAMAAGAPGMPDVERREMKHRHIKEHLDMHHRHEMEHGHGKGEKGEMHKRHLEELTKAHERHEGEHKEMYARHEGAGATSQGKGKEKIEKVTEGEE
jgi:hypothetical protein